MISHNKKKERKISVDKDLEKFGTLIHDGWEQNGTASVENTFSILQQIKQRTTIQTCQILSIHIPKRIEKRFKQKLVYRCF